MYSRPFFTIVAVLSFIHPFLLHDNHSISRKIRTHTHTHRGTISKDSCVETAICALFVCTHSVCCRVFLAASRHFSSTQRPFSAQTMNRKSISTCVYAQSDSHINSRVVWWRIQFLAAQSHSGCWRPSFRCCLSTTVSQLVYFGQLTTPPSSFLLRVPSLFPENVSFIQHYNPIT